MKELQRGKEGSQDELILILVEQIQKLTNAVQNLEHSVTQQMPILSLPVFPFQLQVLQSNISNENPSRRMKQHKYASKRRSSPPISPKQTMEEEILEHDDDFEPNTSLKSIIAGIVGRILATVEILYQCYNGEKRDRAAYESKRLDYLVERIQPDLLGQFFCYLQTWSSDKAEIRFSLANFQTFIDNHDHDDGLLLLNLCIDFLSEKNEDLLDFQKFHSAKQYENNLISVLNQCPENIELGRKLFEETKARFKTKWTFSRKDQEARDPAEILKTKQETLKYLRERGNYLKRLDEACKYYMRHFPHPPKFKEAVEKVALKYNVIYNALATKIRRKTREEKENPDCKPVKILDKNGFKRVKDSDQV